MGREGSGLFLAESSSVIFPLGDTPPRTPHFHSILGVIFLQGWIELAGKDPRGFLYFLSPGTSEMQPQRQGMGVKIENGTGCVCTRVCECVFECLYVCGEFLDV